MGVALKMIMTEKEKIIQIGKNMNCKCNFAGDFIWARCGSVFTVVCNDDYVTKISSMNLDAPSLEIISGFRMLEHLDLTRSEKISELPECISKLTTLKILNFTYMGLTELPEWIGNLTELEELILRHNRITELPDSISNLIQLKGLSLNHTDLIKLPEDIGNLENLEWLDIHGTYVERLPRSLANIPNLKSLRVDGSTMSQNKNSTGYLEALIYSKIMYG